MKLLLALIFFFLFYKGLQNDNSAQTWGGLILMVVCLVWGGGCGALIRRCRPPRPPAGVRRPAVVRCGVRVARVVPPAWRSRRRR